MTGRAVTPPGIWFRGRHGRTRRWLLLPRIFGLLAIAVTGAAMWLPAYWLRQNWRGLAIALGPGMLLMWGAGAAVSADTTGLPVLGRLPTERPA